MYCACAFPCIYNALSQKKKQVVQFVVRADAALLGGVCAPQRSDACVMNLHQQYEIYKRTRSAGDTDSRSDFKLRSGSRGRSQSFDGANDQLEAADVLASLPSVQGSQRTRASQRRRSCSALTAVANTQGSFRAGLMSGARPCDHAVARFEWRVGEALRAPFRDDVLVVAGP